MGAQGQYACRRIFGSEGVGVCVSALSWAEGNCSRGAHQIGCWPGSSKVQWHACICLLSLEVLTLLLLSPVYC